MKNQNFLALSLSLLISNAVHVVSPHLFLSVVKFRYKPLLISASIACSVLSVPFFTQTLLDILYYSVKSFHVSSTINWMNDCLAAGVEVPCKSSSAAQADEKVDGNTILPLHKVNYTAFTD